MTVALATDSALYNLAAAFLNYIDANWPSDVAALPTRQHVAHGVVYWDCEELVVAVERVGATLSDPTIEEYSAIIQTPRFAVVSVWLLRQVPDVDAQGTEIILPTAENVDTSARRLFVDASIVWRLLLEGQSAGQFGGCHSMAFQGWEPAGPEGGFGGGVTRFRVALV